MALIQISEKLNKTETVAQLFSDLISEHRVSLPKLSLPAILLAKIRPGLDADILKTAITLPIVLTKKAFYLSI